MCENIWYLGVDDIAIIKMNWSIIVNKINKALIYWRSRKLTLRGKAIIVNRMILLKVNYLMRVFDMLIWAYREIKLAVTKFIWNYKRVQIENATLINDPKNGSLNLIDLNTKIKGFQVQIINKYLYSREQHIRKSFFLCKVYGCEKEGLFMDVNAKKDFLDGIPMYYAEVFKAWFEILSKIEYNCIKIDQIHNQPIFLNKDIQQHGKYLFNKRFMIAGIRKIKDIITEYVPGFLEPGVIYDQIKSIDDEVSLKHVSNILEKIKGAIKIEWISRINREAKSTNQVDRNEFGHSQNKNSLQYNDSK